AWAIMSLGGGIRDIEPAPRRILDFAKENKVKVDYYHPEKGNIEVEGFDFTGKDEKVRGGSIVTFEWTDFWVIAAKMLGDREFAVHLEAQLQKALYKGTLPYATEERSPTGFGWNTPSGKKNVISTLWYYLATSNVNIFDSNDETLMRSGANPQIREALKEFTFSQEELRKKGVEYGVRELYSVPIDIEKGLKNATDILSKTKDRESRELLTAYISLGNALANTLHPSPFEDIHLGVSLGGKYGTPLNMANIIYGMTNMEKGSKLTPYMWWIGGVALFDDLTNLVFNMPRMEETEGKGGVMVIEGKGADLRIVEFRVPEVIVNAQYDAQTGAIKEGQKKIHMVQMDMPWEKLSKWINRAIRWDNPFKSNYSAIVYLSDIHREGYRKSFFNDDPGYTYLLFRQGHYQYILRVNTETRSVDIVSEALMFYGYADKAVNNFETETFLRDVGWWMDNNQVMPIPSVLRLNSAKNYIEAVKSAYGAEVSPLTGEVRLYKGFSDMPVRVTNKYGVPYNPYTGNVMVPSVKMSLIQWAMERGISGRHTFAVLDKGNDIDILYGQELDGIKTVEKDGKIEYQGDKLTLLKGTKYVEVETSPLKYDSKPVALVVINEEISVPAAVVYTFRNNAPQSFFLDEQGARGLERLQTLSKKVSVDFDKGARITLTPGTLVSWDEEYITRDSNGGIIPGIVEFVRDQRFMDTYAKLAPVDTAAEDIYTGKIPFGVIENTEGPVFRNNLKPLEYSINPADVAADIESVLSSVDPEIARQIRALANQDSLDAVYGQKVSAYRDYMRELLTFVQARDMPRQSQVMKDLYERINKDLPISQEEARHYLEQLHGMEYWKAQAGLEIDKAKEGVTNNINASQDSLVVADARWLEEKQEAEEGAAILEQKITDISAETVNLTNEQQKALTEGNQELVDFYKEMLEGLEKEEVVVAQQLGNARNYISRLDNLDAGIDVAYDLAVARANVLKWQAAQESLNDISAGWDKDPLHALENWTEYQRENIDYRLANIEEGIEYLEHKLEIAGQDYASLEDELEEADSYLSKLNDELAESEEYLAVLQEGIGLLEGSGKWSISWIQKQLDKAIKESDANINDPEWGIPGLKDKLAEAKSAFTEAQQWMDNLRSELQNAISFKENNPNDPNADANITYWQGRIAEQETEIADKREGVEYWQKRLDDAIGYMGEADEGITYWNNELIKARAHLKALNVKSGYAEARNEALETKLIPAAEAYISGLEAGKDGSTAYRNDLGERITKAKNELSSAQDDYQGGVEYLEWRQDAVKAAYSLLTDLKDIKSRLSGNLQAVNSSQMQYLKAQKKLYEQLNRVREAGKALVELLPDIEKLDRELTSAIGSADIKDKAQATYNKDIFILSLREKLLAPYMVSDEDLNK
ncbi:MAG: hypothetical protein PHG40_04970, partial [Candidatus Omnitrophica bacterium]|nr:hypothetical protein [Candidatus Omnitrophota bacterium]